MSEELKNESCGKINISDEVISVVTGVAASKVKGIYGMCNSVSGGIAELFGKKNLSKGVKVEMTESTVKIAASVIVEFGVKIPDVAWEVQDNVKKEVEAMTGLEVTAVDIYVNGVEFPKPEKTEEENIEE